MTDKSQTTAPTLADLAAILPDKAGDALCRICGHRMRDPGLSTRSAVHGEAVWSKSHDDMNPTNQLSQTTRRWPADYPFRGWPSVNGACFTTVLMSVALALLWLIIGWAQHV